ncbi:uncharacterized protein LOC143582461 [Bidens hawaiensis]|uniref:uncharacterized protein LOC143582461 n=1 Tax=Bidens hawaiensis TaxID=980011 RepID=UPI00404B44A6
MYSVSDRKVRVFAVKGVGEDVVKLMRTAVIECEFPVFSVSVSTGFLIFGEEGGVRVFPLRPLVKGRKMSDRPKVQKLKLMNGVASGMNGGSGLYAKSGKVNGGMEEKIGKHYDSSAKLKPLKLRQNSQECGVRFVPFKSKEFEDYESSKVPLMTSIKAVSIQFLAHNKFLILDSDGELYLLALSNHVSGSDSGHEMKKLTLTMKVQNLAVLPDDSAIAGPRTVWVSDGQYTVHAIILSDMDSTPASEDDTSNIEEKLQRSEFHSFC